MLEIIESTYCVEEVEVERTMKERLFSWPWRPWVKNRTDTIPAIFHVKIPPRGYSPMTVKLMPRLEGLAMLDGQEFILAHPQKVDELRILYAAAG